MLGKAKTTVGLDIGSSSIKVVELEQRGDEARLVNFGLAELDPEAIVEGEIMDRQLVVETIQNLFELREIRSKRVITGVSGRGVIVKKITMERHSDQDAEEAIHWEAEQHVPYDINDISLDFEILDAEAGSNQMQVLLVAAKRDLITTHADLVREAGFLPSVIDVNSFAVQNAAELNYDFLAGEVSALVNIGAEITNINLVKNGIPLYTQDLSMGGNSFIEGLQKRYQVGRAEALAALHPGDVKPSLDLSPIIVSFCSDLGLALDRSLVYLKSNGDADSLDRVLLSGGGARIGGLIGVLCDRLKVPVDVVDPLRRVQFAPDAFGAADPHELSPQLTVGVGLAMRKAQAK